MATNLDLEEQEQLDSVKHFWRKWGNLITGVLIVVLGSYSAWQGWQWYQRDQSIKASGLFDELDRAASVNDVAKVTQVFGDLRARYPGTSYAQQAALLAARVQNDGGKLDDALQSLAWAAANAREAEYQTVARLRAAGILLEQKKPDDALKQLEGATAAGFEALVHDRRGDALSALGKADEAKAAWGKAHEAMDATVEYRRLIEAKLTAAGAAPATTTAAAPGAKP